MSNFEKLSALGADVVGGDLIFKHKVLGHFRNGDLQLTEEGQKMLQVDDAVVKEDVPKTTRPARRTAKAAAPVTEPTPEADPEIEPEIDLDAE